MQKKAFSLIELMIVIVIMGVVYTMAATGFARQSEKERKVTLLTLKEYLSSTTYTKSVKLLCLDDCSECDVLIDGEKNATIENFLDDSVKIHRYEFLSGTQEVMKDVYFNTEDIQEDVCFSYEVDKQGIGDQVLVEYKDYIYDFTSALSKVTRYDTMQEALDSKEKLIEEVLR